MLSLSARMATIKDMNSAAGARSGEELRVRRRQRMSNDIELTALRLFAKHGVENVTVDDIAADADISRRTFFRYFASKEDVLHGDPQQQYETLRAAIRDAPQQASETELLRHILLTLVTDYEERREAVVLRKRIAAKSPEAFARSQNRPTVTDAVVAALADYLHVDPATDLRPRAYTYAGFAAMQAAFQHWLETTADGSLHAIAAQALDLIFPR